MSMIINQQTLTISCGDEVVTAERCSEGNDKELFNITVEYFRTGVCATRILTTESGKPFKSNLVLIYSYSIARTSQTSVLAFTMFLAIPQLKSHLCNVTKFDLSSGWMDVLSGSGDIINKTIDFKSHSLIMNQLMIREQNLDTTSFSVNFHG